MGQDVGGKANGTSGRHKPVSWRPMDSRCTLLIFISVLPSGKFKNWSRPHAGRCMHESFPPCGGPGNVSRTWQVSSGMAREAAFSTGKRAEARGPNAGSWLFIAAPSPRGASLQLSQTASHFWTKTQATGGSESEITASQSSARARPKTNDFFPSSVLAREGDPFSESRRLKCRIHGHGPIHWIKS